jgi:hypothetical protein
MVMGMRPLSELEKEALSALAKAVGEDDERDQLIYDLDHCLVEEATPDGSRVIFYIAGYERPPCRGQGAFRGKDQFPVEGTIKDADGADVDMAIFSDQNNRLLTVELVKHSGSPTAAREWCTFRLK